MDVATIIAKNYLAQARVLARSFMEHHPDGRFHVLIIDEVDGFVDPAQEPFELVTVPELGIERFRDMAVMYDVLELSTAVKPWLLKHLLRTGDGSVVYLDPDMRLYAPLDEMFAAVREHGLVLSPHNLGSMPRDGKRPNEQDILIAGVYNLGFVGINSGAFADELLDWWAVRLERDCIVDPERGFFVDQRWMDFAPAMAESFHLLRDPGFNVAYWNLHARPLSERDGTWYVADDVPLRLFHFSGYDHRRPNTLSKHQSRIELESEPELKRLCDGYAEALRADGAEQVAQLPYTYATTASGIRLDGLMRRIYRELTLEGFDASPFESDGESAFLAELNKPASTGAGVTRYLEELYRSREDLQRAYPHLGDGDGPGFIGWANRWGREQVPVAEALLPPVEPESTEPAPPAAQPQNHARTLGVNVAGYLTSEMGVGEVARQMTHALDAVSIPTLPVGITAPRGRHGHPFAGADTRRAGHPVNLVCVNADMLPQFAADAGEGFFADRHTIGMWWWEVSAFPERWHGSFELVDEIWAGSHFVAEALAKVSPVPVTRIPVPVSLPGHPVPARERLGIPEGFVFLFVYDYNSVLARKNPVGLIEAFLKAFPEASEGVSLVLKSINAGHHPNDYGQVVAAAAAHSHIHLIDHFLTPHDKNRLIVSCDAYVSLHRSEGFGITMAEAMVLGKPVVATDYSGNADFMTAENSWPVRHRLQPIGDGAEPYPADAEWAEPDLEHAAASMREVFESPAEVRRRGQQAAQDMNAWHSPLAAGDAIRRRLEKIPLAQLPSGHARGRADAAHWLVDRGAVSPGVGRRMPGRDAARRAVLRTIKPHTAYQAGLDRELAAGIGELADELAGVARRLLELDTGALQEVRALERRLAAVETATAGGTVGQMVGALGDRLDHLAAQVDELRATQEGQARVLRGIGLRSRGAGAINISSLPEAPAEPWTPEYTDRHRDFVAHELDDAALLDVFRSGAELPAGFGVGFDERVVEFPWVAAQRLGGRVLDAGSTLNHLHVLSRLRVRMDDLHIITLAPEDQAFPELDVSYLFADLRELPIADGQYDRVLSISTLEHVGMDNTYYGTAGSQAPDPQRELLAAVRELRRVLRPGGDCYITVPAGDGERYSWVRSLTGQEIDDMVDTFAPERHSVTYYRYSADGWQVSDRDSVAQETYRDHFTAGPVGPDRAVAARAVACLHLVKPTRGNDDR